MALAANTKIVHESEAQRQHVRVRLPADIRFTVDHIAHNYRLNDLSAGGFSFSSADVPYKVGQSFSGQLVMNIDSMGFTIPVAFAVTAWDAHTGRANCIFSDLGPQEIAAIRQIIMSYVAGDLVTAGDMLATLGRQNFVAPRLQKGSAALSIRSKVRAFAGTLIALVLGIIAFSYTIFRLYDIVFVTHATAAKIAAPTYMITMPRDGTFFSLVPQDGKVKKGQPLGSFQTAMLDVVAGVPGSFKLTPQELSQIVGQQLQGSLASPCDCIVQKMFVTDAQYILRNQQVLALVPQGVSPYVLARFHYDEMKRLQTGRTVHFRLNGQKQTINGKITELRVLPAPTIDSNGLNDLNGLNTNAAVTDVIAVIRSSVPLGTSRIDEPVDVLIDPILPSLMNRWLSSPMSQWRESGL
jgi:alginate biosynthesis protein Alg44